MSEPALTPSIIAAIPDVLKQTLIETITNSSDNKRRSILVSSNSLANQFIFKRWSIRSSQRRHYRTLFQKIREQCRLLFNHYIRIGEVVVQYDGMELQFRVFKYDEVRGNLILGIVSNGSDCPFL
ncbi:MAG: hypothetical protein JW779_08080 [Candidatus Thorarchaeota archaeon]|nr:hypothetical protein [Candidatus Thorarchaeota archaeon]